MIFKSLSGRLSATFNIDGGHLQRYLQKRDHITRVICEELVLHDQILIPIQDYFTACGLVLILGEKSVIELLESEKLSFVRLRGAFGYMRGNGPDGTLINFESRDRNKSVDSDEETSAAMGLKVISEKLKDQNKLMNLLVKNTLPVELSDVVNIIKQDCFSDLKSTRLWERKYELSDKNLLALPGMKKMQVRVLGPDTKPKDNPVDALLAISQYNVELHLSQIYSCNTISSSSPLGDLLKIKAKRMIPAQDVSDKLWSLLELNSIPDFGSIRFDNVPIFSDFLRICSTRHATDFRQWFHTAKDLDERELLKEYIGFLREVPFIEGLPSKITRFIITTGLGAIPVIGSVASVVCSLLDTFVIEKIFKGCSPKFLIDSLTQFAGKIKTR